MRASLAIGRPSRFFAGLAVTEEDDGQGAAIDLVRGP